MAALLDLYEAVLGIAFGGAFAPAPFAFLKKRPCAGVFGVCGVHPKKPPVASRLFERRPLGLKISGARAENTGVASVASVAPLIGAVL